MTEDKDLKRIDNQKRYDAELASQGLPPVKTRSIKDTRATKKTTIRLDLTHSQVLQAFNLVESFGVSPLGKPWKWTFQYLMESLLADRVEKGVITAYENDEATRILNENYRAPEQLPIGDFNDAAHKMQQQVDLEVQKARIEQIESTLEQNKEDDLEDIFDRGP